MTGIKKFLFRKKKEFVRMYFDELKKGTRIELESVIIDKNEMIDFAEKYDNVPIHTDEEYAKSTHFGQLIAPGILSFLKVWAKYLEVDLWGEQLIAGKSTKIEWFKPVFAGDILSGIAEITALTERNERNGIAELTIEVFNQNGEKVINSITEAIVKRK